MKYCRNCGGQVEDDDIYCGYCGCKLKQDTPTASMEDKQDFDIPPVAPHFKNDFDPGFSDFDEFSSSEQYNGGSNVDDTEYEYHDEQNFGRTGQPRNANRPVNQGPVNPQTGAPDRKPLLTNAAAKQANIFGTLSIIASVFFGACYLSIVGIAFGIVGLVKAKQAMALCDTGEYDGRPKASNGRITSIIGIIAGVIWLGYYFFSHMVRFY